MALLPFARQAPLDAAERLERWTRERFALDEDDEVMVSQVACGLPGCPPLETVVVFWNAAGRRRRFKVFRPLDEVAPDDLPPSWMRHRLPLDGEDDGCC